MATTATSASPESSRIGVCPRGDAKHDGDGDEPELRDPRNASGYREYSAQDVEVARRIHQLLDAGLSTATIRTVLPCLNERAGRLAPICSDTVEDLRREQARIEAAIEALTASRDALGRVIDAGRVADAEI